MRRSGMHGRLLSIFAAASQRLLCQTWRPLQCMLHVMLRWVARVHRLRLMQLLSTLIRVLPLLLCRVQLVLLCRVRPVGSRRLHVGRQSRRSSPMGSCIVRRHSLRL